MLDRTVERAGCAERADVQLVQHTAGQVTTVPPVIGPGERVMVDDSAPAVHTVGLVGGTRVGQRHAVHDEPVPLRLCVGVPPPVGAAAHR